jgi:hypothetical protein
MARTTWPLAVGDAIETRIIHWDGSRLGISYTYRNDDAEMTLWAARIGESSAGFIERAC